MLQGITVLDFSQYLPGPHTTLRLGDLGAEIIKIESPAGEPTRFPKVNDDNEDHYIFQAQNRNKKSISLNLKDNEDLNIARKLISKADVLIESFRPGVMKRLHLGYEEVKEINPNIVYCSLSGYGQNGSYHQFAGHDLNFMALSGVLSQLLDQNGEPIHPSITLADLIAGIVASESIIAALLKKRLTGKGMYLDISITDALITLMGNHILIEEATGYAYGERKLNKDCICYGLYKTKDHRFISLGALEPKFWRNFCEGIQKMDWISKGETKRTEENEIFVELQQVFRSRTLKEWEQFAIQVDCCMTPVLMVGEVAEHPYVRDRNLIRELWGKRQVVTRCPELGTDIENASPPPRFNEHKHEVLSNLEELYR